MHLLSKFCFAAALLIHGNLAASDLLLVKDEMLEDRAHIVAENHHVASVTIHIACKLTNAVSSRQNCSFIVPARSRSVLVTIGPKESKNKWSFEYSYSYLWGVPQAKHNDRYAYRIPFDKGKLVRVIQGFGGSFSHTGSDRYAIDWDVAERTPIYAARDGIVVQVKYDSKIGGPNERQFIDHANYIRVLHDDGTRGHYTHLAHRGVAVRVGEKIRRGQFIGYSGNTGFSTQPHLHFHVSRVLDGKDHETIPFRFRCEEGDWIEVKQNQSYTVSW